MRGKGETPFPTRPRWNCKYHIVFIPKYRRKEIYGQLRSDIGQILRQLCQYKEVEIIEAHAMSDHIHMLVAIPPKLAVSTFMGYLKGKSSLQIFERHANLKYKYGNRNFWAKGYFVSTVGLNDEVVKEYIRNQENEDMMEDRINLKEYQDPFKKAQK
ncbi:MAG: IS200/IS605 family transposase [Bacilli bacterium]|nr:IS200/IS605 family transposase [Bacilli bacterium]